MYGMKALLQRVQWKINTRITKLYKNLPYSCHSILDFIVGVINVQLRKLRVISFHWQQTTDLMIVFAIQNKRRRSVPTIHRAVNLATHWCEGKHTVKRSNIFHKVLASFIVRVIQISERFRKRWVRNFDPPFPATQRILAPLAYNPCDSSLHTTCVIHNLCIYNPAARNPRNLHFQQNLKITRVSSIIYIVTMSRMKANIFIFKLQIMVPDRRYENISNNISVQFRCTMSELMSVHIQQLYTLRNHCSTNIILQWKFIFI